MNAYACILRIVVCLILFSVPLQTLARTPTPSERVNIFKDLVEAIGAAGDAITKLTDGIRRLVVTGVEGYDVASARSTYSDLLAITKSSTDLAISQDSLIEDFDEYILHPTPRAWELIEDELNMVLGRVNALLSKVRREKSDFVLEPAYETLQGTLQTRGLLLRKLQSLPAPTTEEELEILRQASTQYKRLLKQLRESRDQLNVYLKQHKPS